MWNWIRSWGNVNDRQIKQKSKIKTQQFVTQVWIWDENGKFFFMKKVWAAVTKYLNHNQHIHELTFSYPVTVTVREKVSPKYMEHQKYSVLHASHSRLPMSSSTLRLQTYPAISPGHKKQMFLAVLRW